MSENPYDPPRQAGRSGDRPAPQLITLPKGLAVVLVTAVVGALGGLGIGAALGKFVPNYYRSVFMAGRHPDFDPVAVGIGQGLTQGLLLGVATGLVLVGIMCWYKVRLVRRSEDEPAR